MLDCSVGQGLRFSSQNLIFNNVGKCGGDSVLSNEENNNEDCFYLIVKEFTQLKESDKGKKE